MSTDADLPAACGCADINAAHSPSNDETRSGVATVAILTGRRLVGPDRATCWLRERARK